MGGGGGGGAVHLGPSVAFSLHQDSNQVRGVPALTCSPGASLPRTLPCLCTCSPLYLGRPLKPPSRCPDVLTTPGGGGGRPEGGQAHSGTPGVAGKGPGPGRGEGIEALRPQLLSLPLPLSAPAPNAPAQGPRPASAPAGPGGGGSGAGTRQQSLRGGVGVRGPGSWGLGSLGRKLTWARRGPPLWNRSGPRPRGGGRVERAGAGPALRRHCGRGARGAQHRPAGSLLVEGGRSRVRDRAGGLGIHMRFVGCGEVLGGPSGRGRRQRRLGSRGFSGP